MWGAPWCSCGRSWFRSRWCAPWGARIARFREVEAQLPDIIDRVVIRHERVADVARDVARRLDEILAR